MAETPLVIPGHEMQLETREIFPSTHWVLECSCGEKMSLGLNLDAEEVERERKMAQLDHNLAVLYEMLERVDGRVSLGLM